MRHQAEGGTTVYQIGDAGASVLEVDECGLGRLRPRDMYCQGRILVSVSRSANLIRETDSGYPTKVYDCYRLSLPILRQKMASLVV
jgi:hypothetical protein